METFLQKIGVGNDPWTLRFAGKFAVVYAAAHLAAELEVAPWPASHPFKCVARLYRRARELVATPEEALQDLLRQLAKNASSMDRFPQVGKGDSLPAHLRSVAWGVRSKTRDGIQFLAIPSDRFDGLVHPHHHAVPVRSMLARVAIRFRERKDAHVRQIKVRALAHREALLRLRSSGSIAGAGALIGRQGARRYDIRMKQGPGRNRGFVLGPSCPC